MLIGQICVLHAYLCLHINLVKDNTIYVSVNLSIFYGRTNRCRKKFETDEVEMGDVEF